MFDKLYLEIGGKLFDDTHAARVLPGFKSDAKISVLKELKKDLEIIYCINAGDIEKNKTRGEYGITYDNEVIKLINKSKKMGFSVNSVVITLYKNQVSVNKFIKKLERIKYIAINTKTQIITPTSKGEVIYDVVCKSIPDMLNPELTASWEKGLDMVAKKQIQEKEFMQKLEKYINNKVDKLVVKY